MKRLNLAFVPVERFKLTSGEGELTEYLFDKKTISHRFCRVCGVQTFGRGQKPDGSAMVAVNVRCPQNVDVRALEKRLFDGRSL